MTMRTVGHAATTWWRWQRDSAAICDDATKAQGDGDGTWGPYAVMMAVMGQCGDNNDGTDNNDGMDDGDGMDDNDGMDNNDGTDNDDGTDDDDGTDNDDGTDDHDRTVQPRVQR
ncbi:hypothetical protein EDB84DRAFT_1433156 [Lactarius hengduanensis]|nr:hypothetical protein EDB84DRAFT_1433156 [Lactarius hengduanensis]